MAWKRHFSLIPMVVCSVNQPRSSPKQNTSGVNWIFRFLSLVYSIHPLARWSSSWCWRFPYSKRCLNQSNWSIHQHQHQLSSARYRSCPFVRLSTIVANVLLSKWYQLSYADHREYGFGHGNSTSLSCRYHACWIYRLNQRAARSRLV